MSNHKQTLELLKKLGELRSENYEINWDDWDSYYSGEYETMVNKGIEDYEAKFVEMADEIDAYDDNVDEARAKELEDVIDILLQGYVFQHIFEKKRKIEDFISSI